MSKGHGPPGRACLLSPGGQELETATARRLYSSQGSRPVCRRGSVIGGQAYHPPGKICQVNTRKPRMESKPLGCHTADNSGRLPRRWQARVIVLITAACGFVAPALGQSQVIPLQSGTGPVGGSDVSVRALVNASLSDLMAAQTAPFAVVSKVDHGPGRNLVTDPAARWRGFHSR